jgi:hypothetical protein
MPCTTELKLLVLGQLTRAGRENGRVAVTVSVLGRIPVVGDRLLAHYAQRAFTRLTKSAVWFRGARAHVADDESESLIDADFDLCVLLDRFADGLQMLRAGPLGLQARLAPGHSAKAVDALKLLSRVSAELFEEVQTLKTELMEHDADRAPREEGWTASTAEEVHRLFARL